MSAHVPVQQMVVVTNADKTLRRDLPKQHISLFDEAGNPIDLSSLVNELVQKALKKEEEPENAESAPKKSSAKKAKETPASVE